MQPNMPTQFDQTNPPAPRKHGLRTTLIILGGVAALCLVGGVVAAAVSGDPDPAAPPAAATTRDPTPALTTESPAADPTTPPPPATKAAPPAPARIQGNDVVHAGYDVPAGVYRATTNVDPGAGCYWNKSTDAEGQNIIANNIVEGGRPQVTLKKGQWFTTQDCPDWTLQK